MAKHIIQVGKCIRDGERLMQTISLFEFHERNQTLKQHVNAGFAPPTNMGYRTLLFAINVSCTELQ